MKNYCFELMSCGVTPDRCCWSYSVSCLLLCLLMSDAQTASCFPNIALYFESNSQILTRWSFRQSEQCSFIKLVYITKFVSLFLLCRTKENHTVMAGNFCRIYILRILFLLLQKTRFSKLIAYRENPIDAPPTSPRA